MPTLRITTGASHLIAKSFRAGKTAREIAGQVERRFGLRLSHTTISRHARSIGGDVARAARRRGKRKPAEDGPELAASLLDVPAGDDGVTLLELVVRVILALLDPDMPQRSEVDAEAVRMLEALAAGDESRLRRVVAASTGTPDVAFMVATMRRFAELPE